MNKKIISTMIAVTLATTTLLPAISVSANPSEKIVFDKDTQNKYSEIQSKYNELEQKIQGLDDQISALICKIDNNNAEKDNVNKEIDNTKKEIEQKKEDIKEQEEILGIRLRELYKFGGHNSYISLLFSAEDFGDLISKIDSTAKLVSLDKKIVGELEESKDKLDDSIESLEKKSAEIEDLNYKIEEQKVDLNSKKEEQKKISEEVRIEKEKFEAENLVPMETAKVKDWINQAIDSTNTEGEVKYSVGILKACLPQIKSETVKSHVQSSINKGEAIIAQKKEEQKVAEKSSSSNTSYEYDSPAINTSVIPSGNANDLIAYAMRFIGVPYVYGGEDPSGFDCSGFTQYVFNNAANIGLGRTTYQQINNGIEVSRAEMQPGDLVFPNDGHVGIYIGNNQMIHAPHTGASVTIAPVYAFWRARRILR